jgi:negative regulator of flagellin synthesis FlgM
MRINDKQFITTEKNERAADAKRTDAKRATDNRSAATTFKTDSVDLSARSRDVAEIAQQLKDSADVREGLVSELRAKIKSGEYHVSGMEIAGKIVNTAANGIY